MILQRLCRFTALTEAAVEGFPSATLAALCFLYNSHCDRSRMESHIGFILISLVTKDAHFKKYF